MSLARAAALATRAKSSPSLSSQTRRASTAAHDEHHDAHAVDHHHDATQYPEEGFASRGWIYTIVGAAGLVAFYKYAPAKGEANLVTDFLYSQRTPKEIWDRINDKHLDMSFARMGAILLTQDAKTPPLRRYRYPQQMNIASPMNVPVGLDVDVSHVKPKTDMDW
ncbi:uncharacterized protein STEHIDRAFT_104466 [Stereum hirsutum FP-91666 SS1]|uniref:uncharacterized protein n=1 Tax=Stereum hirsutum (strain FP-91666) TaxID=721885 RepID=UPI000444A324|nr:uncharacterized protein STEHIDRAFT_104466 [Stereum hirsutum FP-91666 SS1]EIM81102.1 hypothetical protein STEHIDRAFT_104466 [Stereum hirsutum FP-91666 SS1]